MDVNQLKTSLIPPLVTVTGPPGVRAVVRRTKSGDYLLHIYSLNVARKDTYHDEVIPAENVKLEWYLPEVKRDMKSFQLLTPDNSGTSTEVKFTKTGVENGVKLTFVIPKLTIWTIAEAKITGK